MKARKFNVIFATALGLFTLPATAAPIQSTVGILLTFADCQLPTPTSCGLLSTVLREYAGAPGDLSAAGSQSLAGYGQSSASVSLSGEIGAPILRTSASSESGKRVNTNTVALQRFVYTGETTTERTFGGDLTYAQTVVNPGESGVNAVIEIFEFDGDFIEVGETPEDNFWALFSGLSGLVGKTTLAFDQWIDTDTNPSGSATLGATVTLEPGDAIWVYTRLQTPASLGSVVDASRTLITRWDDSSGLVPANFVPPPVVGVPEPASLALLVGGLLYMGFVRRKRKSRKGIYPALLAVLLLPMAASAAPVTIGANDWMQPLDTVGYSWNHISGVCDPTTGACMGSLGTVDLTGWTWASIDDVRQMFADFPIPGFSGGITSVSELDSA